jgi:hypothetical protein
MDRPLGKSGDAQQHVFEVREGRGERRVRLAPKIV